MYNPTGLRLEGVALHTPNPTAHLLKSAVGFVGEVVHLPSIGWRSFMGFQFKVDAYLMIDNKVHEDLKGGAGVGRSHRT